LPIKWNVLLKEDGAYLDLIYNGSPDVKIAIDGIILGQDKIEIYQNKIGFSSPEEEYKEERKTHARSLVIAPILGLASTFADSPFSRAYPAGLMLPPCVAGLFRRP
jgi:hypothetical protein